MRQVVELSAPAKDQNQLVRWVMNKDQHAEEFGHIVTQYFMRQRLKPGPTPGALSGYDQKYVQQLVLLHELYVLSMKFKQTTELKHVEAARLVLKRFKVLYHQH